jgi:hypothetical protein
MIRYFLRGTASPLLFELSTGLNTVGRNPTNDCVIHEASVSSFHAEVTVADNGIFIRDLQSTNGTFINDDPVTESQLRPGQVVQFGTVTLRLEQEEVHISVPQPVNTAELAFEQPVLEDGSAACAVNPTVQATHRCQKCERAYNMANLRFLKLSGGSSYLLFCPNCGAKAEPIPGVQDKGPKKSSLLARISQTIQLGFRRGK